MGDAVRLPLAARVALAEALRRKKAGAAEAVTEEFLARHPEWPSRFGERARIFGLEDAAFHVDFLAAAIEAGSAQAFEHYARWTARMLAARGIEPAFLAENLEQVRRELSRALDAAGVELVAVFVAAGQRAALYPHAPAPGSTGGLAETRQVLLQTVLLGWRAAATTVLLEALRDGAAIKDMYISRWAYCSSSRVFFVSIVTADRCPTLAAGGARPLLTGRASRALTTRFMRTCSSWFVSTSALPRSAASDVVSRMSSPIRRRSMLSTP